LWLFAAGPAHAAEHNRMTADHLSYKRATSVALLGLAIQTILGVALLLYAIFGEDPAAMSGAIAIGLGVPIWVALALVFHQHRLERLEALEADAYRQSAAAQASVFEEAGIDQQVQSGRLAWMHRLFLPSIGLLIGAAYLGLGILLFILNRDYPHLTPFERPPKTGFAIAIGVGMAAIGFIFARFVAGMAKQKIWSLLNAGSAASVGAAVIGVALVLSHFVATALNQNLLVRFLPVAIDIYMIALGAEMLLNFVLNLYRPRRSGEYLRPAFDSRVLAFVAAPDQLAASISDAINYQFGFNVSSTWFYRLLSRSVGGLLLLGVLLIWGMSVVSVVKTDELGLKVTNGRLAPPVGAGPPGQVNPGLVWKLPWPFASVTTFPAKAVNEINVGTLRPTGNEPILWTNQHSPQETFFFVQAGRATDGAAGDALLAAEIPVHYVVSDLTAYMQLAQDGPRNDRQKFRQSILKSIASGVAIQQMAHFTVEEVLGAKRSVAAAALATEIQRAYDAIDCGVRVTFVGVSGVHPERETAAPAFEGVVQADQNRQATIERAREFEIKTLARVAGNVDRARQILQQIEALNRLRTSGADEARIAAQEQEVADLIVGAGGEAAQILARANAARWRKHMGERARAVRSEGQIVSYRAAPRSYRMALYLDALRESARHARVWILPETPVRIRFDATETQPDLGPLEGELSKIQE